MYLSAMVSLKCCPASKAYYDRKSNEGKSHKQALLALARRRVNVLPHVFSSGGELTPRQKKGASYLR
jgi:hypothetical protein